MNPKKMVAIDVGTHIVKVLQLKKTSAGFELVKFGFSDVLFSKGEDNTVSLTQARSEGIRRALKHAGISTNNSMSAISGDSAVVRFIQLPDMPHDELKSALHWEAQEILPFPVENVLLDYKTLAYPKTGDQTNAKLDILVVAAEKSVVAEHEALLQSAQIRPVSINVDIFALLRSYEYDIQGTKEENTTAVLVNIGASQSNLVISGKGGPRFVRDIAISGNTMTEIIAQRVGCSFARAEQLKIERGIILQDTSQQNDEKRQEPIADTMLSNAIQGSVDRRLESESSVSTGSTDLVVDTVVRQILGNLCREIVKTVAFYENVSGGDKIGHLVLAGGTACMRGIDEFFAAETSFAVKIFNPLSKITLPVNWEKDLNLSQLTPSLGIAVGLAIQVYDNQEFAKNINIASSVEKTKGMAKRSFDFSVFAGGQKFTLLLTIFVVIIAISLFAGWTLFSNVNEKTQEKKDVTARLEKNKTNLKKAKTKIAQISKFDQSIEDKYSIVSSLAPPDRIYWSEKLNMLSKARGGRQIYIEKLQLKEDLEFEETKESIKRREEWADRKQQFEKQNADSKKKFLELEPKKIECPIVIYSLIISGIASGKDSSERLETINQYAESLANMRWRRASGQDVGFVDGFDPAYRVLEQQAKNIGGVEVMGFGLAFDSMPMKLSVNNINLAELITSATGVELNDKKTSSSVSNQPRIGEK